MTATECRAARAALERTQTALAELLGVTSRTVQRWERDGTEPAAEPAARLLRLLASRPELVDTV